MESCYYDLLKKEEKEEAAARRFDELEEWAVGALAYCLEGGDKSSVEDIINTIWIEADDTYCVEVTDEDIKSFVIKAVERLKNDK